MVVIGKKWLYSDKSGYTRVKVFVFGQGSRNRESSCIRAKLVVIGQREFIGEKVVLFRQQCFYSGKRCCIRANVVVFGQTSFFGVKVVVFGQKWLYFCKVVVFGQKFLYSGKVVVFGQSCCILGKSGFIRAKW